MGEFTQNLLKLTEFPFSYSLIGLLALIFGKGINPGELSFEKFGPLLILMGFVATTLSICDPVGSLQRQMLKGKELVVEESEEYVNWWELPWIFRKELLMIFPTGYLFAIAYHPEDIKKRFRINWKAIKQWFESFDKGFTTYKEYEEPKDYKTSNSEELNKIGIGNETQLFDLITNLKRETVKTKWITAEIDRITALIYFVLVISLFIIATQIYADFLPKFGELFGNTGFVQAIIFVFSVLGLLAVVVALLYRIGGLHAKALTVFKYLTALGAIKMAKQDFRPTQDEIEGYLNDNHWPLAEYWVNRLQVDYTQLFLEEVTRP